MLVLVLDELSLSLFPSPSPICVGGICDAVFAAPSALRPVPLASVRRSVPRCDCPVADAESSEPTVGAPHPPATAARTSDPNEGALAVLEAAEAKEKGPAAAPNSPPAVLVLGAGGSRDENNPKVALPGS